MRVTTAEKSVSVTTRVATAIILNARVKTGTLGYKVVRANSCQLGTLLKFFIFFKGFRDTSSLNSRRLYFAR
jgi:hypothetical protein